MNPDRDAQKQLLLTRIAIERLTLRRDTARVQRAVNVPQLLRSAVGAAGIGRALFGASALPTSAAGWLATALSLLKRYRVAATVVSSVAPMVLGRKPIRRLLRVGSLAAAGAGLWLGWRAMQRRDR